MITKELFYLYHLTFNYVEIAKVKNCISFQVKDALEMGIIALRYQEEKCCQLKSYDISFKDQEAFNTFEIDFLFKDIIDYKNSKKTIDDLIEYFLEPDNHNLKGQNITLDNYSQMLNQIYMSHKLDGSLEEKEDTKKIKL